MNDNLEVRKPAVAGMFYPDNPDVQFVDEGTEYLDRQRLQCLERGIGLGTKQC